jgi:hypothetical protein
MPLLDHFHPPLATRRHWESFHAAWAVTLVDALMSRWLPPGYIAEEQVHAGRTEIDVATFDEDGQGTSGAGAAAAAVSKVWVPPRPAVVVPAVFPGTFEVQVLRTEGGTTLVAAIELISPANKDRADQRRAFAAKCASYLYGGVSLIIVDIVTSRGGNLHNDTMRLMETGEAAWLPQEVGLYAVAYRPVRRGQDEQIEMWPTPLALGRPLPVLPLGLSGEVCIPVDLEETYVDLCRRRRLLPEANGSPPAPG